MDNESKNEKRRYFKSVVRVESFSGGILGSFVWSFSPKRNFPDAGDIDLAVTDRGLEELKENYSLKPKGNGWYQVSDCIECVCDGKKENLSYQPEKIGEYYVQNIEEYEAYLKTSTREKDQKRIPIVRAYIQKRNGK